MTSTGTTPKTLALPVDDTDDQHGVPHRIAAHNRDPKTFRRGSIVIMALTLLLVGIVAGNFILEGTILVCNSQLFLLRNSTNAITNVFIISNNDTVNSSNDTTTMEENVVLTCTLVLVNVSEIEYRSGHRYYSILKNMGPLPPPVFRGDHTTLCNANNGADRDFQYCLPISGRKDSPFCTRADRMNLLIQYPHGTHCYANVLHMLLVEVYEELQALGKVPIVVFESLLGAVRNGSMIPFTEDSDIAYSGQLEGDDELAHALRDKGYHFFYNMWRVCVAPTHPLASRLYNAGLPIAQEYAVPYLGLYTMEKMSNAEWSLEGFGDDETLPEDKVQPFSHVTINGLPFNTVHDTSYFLVEMYGEDYMTPKPRQDE